MTLFKTFNILFPKGQDKEHWGNRRCQTEVNTRENEEERCDLWICSN